MAQGEHQTGDEVADVLTLTSIQGECWEAEGFMWEEKHLLYSGSEGSVRRRFSSEHLRGLRSFPCLLWKRGVARREGDAE